VLQCVTITIVLANLVGSDPKVCCALQCGSVCCSVLQCTAVTMALSTRVGPDSKMHGCYSVLQCDAVCCRVLPCVVCSSELLYGAVCCSVQLLYGVVYCVYRVIHSIDSTHICNTLHHTVYIAWSVSSTAYIYMQTAPSVK